MPKLFHFCLVVLMHMGLSFIECTSYHGSLSSLFSSFFPSGDAVFGCWITSTSLSGYAKVYFYWITGDLMN